MLVVNARTPLSKKAEAGVDALFDADARTLYGYASEREKTEGGLTRERLQRVLDKLVKPYLRRAERPSFDHMEDTGGFHASANMVTLREDGARIPVSFELWETDEGVRSGVLRQVLLTSWLVRFGRFQGGRYNLKEGPRDIWEGCETDRAFLESIGLRGYVHVDPAKPFRTWEQIQQAVTERLASMQVQPTPLKP